MEINERLAKLEEAMTWVKDEMKSVVNALNKVVDGIKAFADIETKHKGHDITFSRAFREIEGLKDRVEVLEKKEPVSEVYFSGIRAFLYMAAVVVSNVVTAVVVAYMVKR